MSIYVTGIGMLNISGRHIYLPAIYLYVFYEWEQGQLQIFLPGFFSVRQIQADHSK